MLPITSVGSPLDHLIAMGMSSELDTVNIRDKSSRSKRLDYQRLQRTQHGCNTLCKPLIQRREFVTHGYGIRYSKNLLLMQRSAKIVAKGQRD